VECVAELETEGFDDFEAVGVDEGGVEAVCVVHVCWACSWGCLLSGRGYDLNGRIVLLGLEVLR
jgi:hypothetical protein